MNSRQGRYVGAVAALLSIGREHSYSQFSFQIHLHPRIWIPSLTAGHRPFDSLGTHHSYFMRGTVGIKGHYQMEERHAKQQ